MVHFCDTLCQNTIYEQILNIVIVKISISIEVGVIFAQKFMTGSGFNKDIKKLQIHPACIFVLDKGTKSFAARRRQCAAFLFIINNRINLSAVSPPAIKGLLRPIGGSKCWSGTPWCADNSAKLLNFSARPELFTDVCAGEGSDYSEAPWWRR